MADDIGKTVQGDFYDWSGIDHYSSPFLAKENTLEECINFVSTGVVGGKMTRPPYAQVLNKPDTSAIQNLIYFIYYNSSGIPVPYWIRISGGNFYAYEVGVSSNWGSAIGGFTCTVTTIPFAWAILANRLHLTNGTDVYQTWDPTNGFVTYPEAPTGLAMVAYQNRIHLSNVPGNVGRDYFSTVDFTGAPGETSYLTGNISSSATSASINDPIFLGGNNPNLSANAPSSTGMHWRATLGVGTANQESVIVTGITASTSGANIVAPYTITFSSATAHSHAQYDVISNDDPWYSDNNNASSANYFDPNNTGAVIALDVVNNNLILHKSSGGIYLYNGNTISNPLQGNNPAFNAPGNATASPYAIDQINGIEFFPNRDGVYAYSGGYPTNISYNVYDLIQNMTGSQIPIAPGIAFKQKYYYTIGTVTDRNGIQITNCILVYDYILNLWETYSLGITPTAFAVVVDANGNQQLIFGDNAGYTYQFNTGVGNNGSPANAILQTHYLTWGAPEKTKEWLSYCLNTNPGANFQFQAAVDWSNKWQPITTTSGFGVSASAPITMKNFNSIAFRLISNSAIPMTFYGFNVKINVGPRRDSGRRI